MNPFANVPIVVPIDFSDEDDRALDIAVDLASSPGDVHAIHVCPPLTLYESGAVVDLPLEATCQEMLAAFRDRFPDDRYQDVQFDVRFGVPAADEIVEYAAHIDAGLVVVSMHPRTGVLHLLFSSIAERVLRGAACPVLVLRT
jgi:nucleotide-binding universal stress UspA family protein